MICICPAGRHIICEPMDGTPAVMPDGTKGAARARVIAVGPQVSMKYAAKNGFASSLAKGQVILHYRHNGVATGDYLILCEDSIYAVEEQ